ncbi:spermidine synthase [Patescibacteria group bacterium]|nr:spermidine synthase [Patescibacteria group bacterium]MBU4481196.1 spermidine synthase [Patescibacteria group bacterium]
MKKKFWGKTWFFEDFIPSEPKTSVWGFQIEKEIYSGKSKFQEIEVLGTKEFGRVLVLDGLVQLSTKHEFVYHETLVRPAFLYHRKPEKVLIIGGGDGGSLREVVKHPVKEIFLCDIDKKVIEVSKKYLPSVSQGAFNDKRLKIFNEDALNFVKKYKNYFDVIIEDLTDPTGLSFRLWQIGFYKDISRTLKENGVAAFQSGYLNEKFAKKARKNIKEIFLFFKAHKAFVGCFPFDEHTFSFGSKEIDFEKVS